MTDGPAPYGGRVPARGGGPRQARSMLFRHARVVCNKRHTESKALHAPKLSVRTRHQHLGIDPTAPSKHIGGHRAHVRALQAMLCSLSSLMPAQNEGQARARRRSGSPNRRALACPWVSTISFIGTLYEHRRGARYLRSRSYHEPVDKNRQQRASEKRTIFNPLWQ